MTSLSEQSPLIESTNTNNNIMTEDQKATKSANYSDLENNHNNNTNTTTTTKNDNTSPLIPIIVTIIVLIINALVAAATDLWKEAIISFGIQYIVFFSYAWPYRSEKFYDFTGMITFLCIIIFSFLYYIIKYSDMINARNIILSLMVCIWTIRLGSFLFERIKGEGGKDKRFDEIRINFYRFIMAWSFQGAWCYFLTLPVTMVNLKHSNQSIQASDIIGWIIWLSGFICEIISDHQKKLFTKDPNNKGKFINVGLWKYSRHPNYFGEIVLWIGIAVSAATVATDWDWLLLLSPIYTATLLIFVSGLPPTEKRADEKFKGNQGYEEYKQNTPVLIPFCYCWK